jgi:hypothetical protein
MILGIDKNIFQGKILLSLKVIFMYKSELAIEKTCAGEFAEEE